MTNLREGIFTVYVEACVRFHKAVRSGERDAESMAGRLLAALEESFQTEVAQIVDSFNAEVRPTPGSRGE